MCGVKAPTVTKSQEWNKSSQPEKDIPSGCTWHSFNALLAEFQHFGGVVLA